MVRSCEFRKMALEGLLLGEIERRTKAQDAGIVRTWGAAVWRPYNARMRIGWWAE